MTKEQAAERGEMAMSNDPRQFPYGYFSGGSFVLDSVRVFMWFASPKELLDHLCECDPVIHDLDKEEASSFAEIVHKIVGEPVVFNDEKRQKINSAAKDFLCIEWWGTFHELTNGKSELATNIRESMRKDVSGGPVTESEMDDFVELVQTYGF
jgi:hypothetical protein